MTRQQHEVILHRDSPLLIIAGLGSGKTEIITILGAAEAERVRV